MARFDKTYCSQCGGEFGPGDEGYSHCSDHRTDALHPRTADLVDRFAAALKEKLADAEKKYGYSDGWASPDWMNECRQHLREHIEKGDPRDVAAYCAFLWHHGQSTANAPMVPARWQGADDSGVTVGCHQTFCTKDADGSPMDYEGEG